MPRFQAFSAMSFDKRYGGKITTQIKTEHFHHPKACLCLWQSVIHLVQVPDNH